MSRVRRVRITLRREGVTEGEGDTVEVSWDPSAPHVPLFVTCDWDDVQMHTTMRELDDDIERAVALVTSVVWSVDVYRTAGDAEDDSRDPDDAEVVCLYDDVQWSEVTA